MAERCRRIRRPASPVHLGRACQRMAARHEDQLGGYAKLGTEAYRLLDGVIVCANDARLGRGLAAIDRPNDLGDHRPRGEVDSWLDRTVLAGWRYSRDNVQTRSSGFAHLGVRRVGTAWRVGLVCSDERGKQTRRVGHVVERDGGWCVPCREAAHESLNRPGRLRRRLQQHSHACPSWLRPRGRQLRAQGCRRST